MMTATFKYENILLDNHSVFLNHHFNLSEAFYILLLVSIFLFFLKIVGAKKGPCPAK